MQSVSRPVERLAFVIGMVALCSAPACAAPAAAEPPEWAVTECRGLKAMSEVVYYWLDRQSEDGSFGFGLDDDCEFYTAWTILVYAADDQRVLESLRKGLDWVWYHDNVQDGYQAEPGDAEHSSEITSYSQPLLTIADYGNPILIERMMETSKNMERWTAVNRNGHRLFRSHWIGSQGVNDYAYFAADATMVARATIPMMHYLWYARDPDLLRLCVEWCRSWLDHAKDTRWGKPYGLLPAEIVFATDEAGGFTKNWWDSASSGFPLCDSPWYMVRMHEMLVVVYMLTGDPEFLIPLRETLKFFAVARPDNLPAGVTMWPAWMTERTPPRYGRKPEEMPFVWEYYKAKMNQELVDFYHLATGGDTQFDQWWHKAPAPPTRKTALDSGRSAIEGAAAAKENARTINIKNSVDNYRANINTYAYPHLYHGGNNWVDLPRPSVRWRNGDYELAVVLLDHSPRTFKALCCNTGDRKRSFGAQLFELEPGTYSLTLGIDADQDDRPDRLLRDEMVAIDRGTEFALDLDRGHEYIVELQQVARGKEWTSRPDVAVCSRDLFAVPASPEPDMQTTLQVRVHNIGTEDARQVTVWARELGTDKVIGDQVITLLPRPRDMIPSHATVQMPWVVGPGATGVRVTVDAADLIDEIYEGNNAAEIALADLPEEPRRKRRVYIPTWWTQGDLGPVAKYTAPYVEGITLDGKLDDPGWAKAERRGPLQDLDGRPNEKQTYVRIAYGADAVYFAVEAPEPDMSFLVEAATKHDSHGIFADDAVEIFIDTNLDKRTYYQFVFTTAGVTAEGQYYNFSIYNDPWECKVYKGKDVWTAEAKIPYSSLKAPARPGKTWGVNIYRNTKTFRAPESEEERRKGWKEGERNALSPTFGGHHEPHRFAEVTFGPRD